MNGAIKEERNNSVVEERPLQKHFISRGVDSFFLDVTNILKFIGQFFKEVFKPPYEPREIIAQCYQVGYRSLALISLTGFIVGIVFTKQSRPALEDFGATSWLPSLVGIAVIRALAPLITALICAGKVGSNIGAELGSMKVSEQIDAMEMLGVDPYKYLVVTRVIATTVMVPVLVMYITLIGLLGSYLNVHTNEQTTIVTFFHNALTKISFLDYTSTCVRAILYGFTIGIVGCYKGFNASNGTVGVGRAANASVVISMFLIFIEEIIVVQIFNWIRYV